MRKPKLVVVTWIDSSHSTRAWLSDKSQTIDLLTCRTAGYVHEKTKTKLVIASSYTEEGQPGGVSAIPRGCIKAIKRLR